MNKNDSLPIGEAKPAFGCVVYIKSSGDGVSARVANLDGLTVTATDERAALAKLVPAFRSRLSTALEAGDAVPWIDPPLEKQADEIKRFLPVHL